MKTNKMKLSVIGLSAVLGLAFIGSIGGTVAWYQYSTLANAAYTGASAKCTENLQVSVNGTDFKSSLTTDDIADYLKDHRAEADASTVNELKPVTAGNQDKNAALNTLKSNPVYQEADYSKWEDAVNTDYVTFPLTFRVLDIDGSGNDTLLAQDRPLAVSDLTIDGVGIDENNAEGKEDISSAIRVHFAGKNGENDVYRLAAKDVAETDTFGELDLNGDGDLDTDMKYEWDTSAVNLVYGTAGSKETAYTAAERTAKGEDGSYTNTIGVIKAGETRTVNVTIFLEGWQKLSGSALWDASKYIGAKFRVGRTFEIPKLEKKDSVRS